MPYPIDDEPSNHAHGDDLECELKQAIKEPSKQLFIKERLNQSGLTELKFSSLNLVGREREIDLLKGSLERLESSGKREFVLLSGQSGTGKTLLASWAQKRAKSLGAVVAREECETTTRDHPYAGIASLGNHLCSLLEKDDFYKSSKDERIDCMKSCSKRMLDILDTVELSLIGNIIPSIYKIVPPSEQNAQTSKINIESAGEMKGRQMLAIQKFVCLVASIAPLVLMMDDLQWSDTESLEIIRALMTSRDEAPMLVLGCHRISEEEEGEDQVDALIRDIRSQNNATFTSVLVGNLDVDSVQNILSILLNSDSKQRINPLAELCHRRTLGNCFFLLSFITMLRDKEYLKFNITSFSWDWDIATIERATDATKNVVDLIMGQLAAATPEIRTLLQVATCLGSRFKKKVLYNVWIATKAKTTDAASFTTLLDECVSDKYLETSDGETYGFVHGNIQESVTNSVSRHEFESLQWTIGLLLSDKLKFEDTTNQIFVVTNLLNNAWTAGKDNVRERLIQLNLKAAERAMRFSAYSTAAHYAGLGIRYWEEEMWKTNRTMGVALYSIAAKSEHSTGQWEKAQEYCNDVLQRKDLSLLEKSALHCTLMDLKCNPLKQHEEALEIALHVLQELSCKFPKYGFVRVSASLKNLYKLRRPPDEEEIAKLPVMDDPVKLMAANIMSKAFPLTHYTKNFLLAVLLSVRLVRWTLQFGITDDSPSAFAGLGMMINQFFGAFENGSKYCEIALSMLGRTPSRKRHANATLLSVMGLAFSKPIPSLLDPLLNGYKAGMAEGDIEMAMWNMNSYLTMQLYCGKLLKHVNNDFEVYVPQMKALKQSEPHDSTVPSWDVAMELAGHTDQRTKSMMKEGFAYDNSGESSEIFLPVHTLFLHAILGQYEMGAKCASEKVVKHLKKMQSIGMTYCFVCFYAGISFYAMARKSGRYKRHANNCRMALHSAVKKGNPNAVHHVKFLDAEHEALASRSKGALELYQEAISFAGRLGFLQDVALANERCAQLFLNSSDPNLDNDEASFRIQESIKYYSEWGAERKVRLLKEAHANIIKMDKQ